ncbi:amidase [Spiribacter halobius]|uniref:Amidase n=1 Tax=Sediminicurvatus halobius TaxID=2182432 RepID=A0A2U2N626_9GAMM|nr:amidase [Spiribacter halobius]PWG64570.1 amidase [Spiribacter halobius]UEX79110.1 amidase [Spiribacter halobius]
MNTHNRLTATMAAARIARGELTSEALVEACLERIEAREPDVAAWACLDPEHALRQARERDREAPRGPLHGIPVAFKDIIDTADLPTACGSPLYRGRQPVTDAACVARARAAGAVVLGKTVTTEFAGRYAGRTANPHDRRHSPGGSSSGSAAAVADGMVPLAIGSQTLGSVIRPAAYCGVRAYKPTFGLLSFVGVKHFAESFDTLGLMARSVEDLQAFRAALTGGRCGPAEGAGAPPRIALCRTPYWDEVSPRGRECLESAAARLADAGAAVTELTLPAGFAEIVPALWQAVRYEAADALLAERVAGERAISRTMRELLDEGAGIAQADHLRSLATLEAARREIGGLLEGVDIVLAPSAPGEAPEGLQDTGSPTYNALWHALELPAVNLPAGTGERDLPLGVQLVARRYDDDALLRHARWCEARLSPV